MESSEGKKSKLENTRARRKFLVLFGTRPETIKLAPVIREFENRKIKPTIVCSSQHSELLTPVLDIFKIKPDHDLRVMKKNQSPNDICAKVLKKFDKILRTENPDCVIVQGDTTTTMAGALAAFNRKILVAHVEAGLRSGNAENPFPEEMNRRVVSQVATFHFCATEKNRENLLAEGINPKQIFVTGNTVVDSLKFVSENFRPSRKVEDLINQTEGTKRILLTTHRRESFGAKMRDNLLQLKKFVGRHEDVRLFFPVHPNPSVREATKEILSSQERIFLIEPLGYVDFISLMKSAWLTVSDSGGVQEETPSLGKPLLILRENTERPEAVESGIAKLVGKKSLLQLLEENYADKTWISSVKKIKNPFGDGKSAQKIVKILLQNR